MQDVFHEAVNLLEQDERLVMATVVRTKGSTPQKPGAKLLVRNDGSGVGTLGGGCVEGDIWYAASQLMRRGGDAQHREYELNEDLAAQDGLVCGGTMFFLIDPVYRPDDYLDFAREIDAAYAGGPSVAQASLIKPPEGGAGVGSKLFMRENGETVGTLGDDALDRDALKRASELMAMGRNEYVTTEDGAEYFIEAYTTPPQLVICGGGHVSRALASHAKPLGFRLFITDDRDEFANAERFPEADIIVAEKPEDALGKLPINPNTFIVVATRGHRFDNVALAAAADTPGAIRRPHGQQAKDHPDIRRPGEDGHRRGAAALHPLAHRPGHPRADAGGDSRQYNGGDTPVQARRKRAAHEAGTASD